MNAIKRLFSLFNVVALLLLIAAYLAYEAVQKPPMTPAAPQLQLAQQRDVKVKVYYSDAQVQNMKAETRTVQVTQENPGALAQAALNVWAKGPSAAGNLAVVPKGTAAPRVYIRGAHYFVDLPTAYQNLKYGSSGERILLCTMTRTLLETRGEDVTFLVNGQDVDTLGHLDLREAFTRQDCADQ